MSDNRPVCVNCRVRMKCAKNDVKVKLDETAVAFGDKYACPDCGQEVITGFGKAILSYDNPQLVKAPADIHLKN